MAYPQYDQGARSSELDALGPLAMPQSESGTAITTPGDIVTPKHWKTKRN
jgi:hypothetical protein